MKYEIKITFYCYSILFNVSNMHVPIKKIYRKKLVIARNETVRINELDMTITNYGCKGNWKESDFPGVYCNLIVKTKDSTWHFGKSFSPLLIKNLKLVIDQTNPWEWKLDSIPPGGCRIIVTRLADLSR